MSTPTGANETTRMKDIRPLVKQNRTSLVLGSLILPNSGWLLANCAVPPTGRANLVLITVDTLRATSWPTATSVPPHLTPRWKYIHNPKRYSSPGAADNGSGYFGFFRIAIDELYDLQADPGEHHDVASRHPEVVTALRERLVAWLENGEEPGPAPAITPESRAELKALGYLE
jgi:hypothetical protein